jgi:hypothetical protein
VAVGDLAWQIAGVGGYDGDGRDELLWRNGSTGANVIWDGADSLLGQALAPVAERQWTLPAQTGIWLF